MGRGGFVLALALATAAAAARQVEVAEVVATVSVVGGQVETRLGSGDWARVAGARPVREGERVRALRRGQALLLQPGCPVRPLRSGEVVTISAGKRWATGISPSRLTTPQHAAIQRLLALAERATRTQPAKRDAPERVARELVQSPRNELVITGRPRFRWRDTGTRSSYQLDLYCGDRLVWHADPAEHRADYPADRGALAPGNYSWRLFARPAAGRLEAEEGRFRVPSSSDRERIRGDLAAALSLLPEEPAGLPLLAICLARRLHTPAEVAARKALHDRPDDVMLLQALAAVYSAKEQPGALEEVRRRLALLSSREADPVNP